MAVFTTFAANFIPRMVAIATKFEVNGTYGYTKKRLCNLSPLAITPLARREACLAGEDLVEEAARGETTGVRHRLV